MITEFIKKGDVILTIDDKSCEEEPGDKFEELSQKETIKSIELVFEENTTFAHVEDLFQNQNVQQLLTQKVYLHD